MQSNIQQYYPSFYTFYESHFFPGQTPDLSHDPNWAIWLAEVRKFHQHHDRMIIWFAAKNGICARVWTIKWTGPWNSLIINKYIRVTGGAIFFWESDNPNKTFPVKFQGRTALKIVEFDPNWAFPDCNSNLNSPMGTKWYTKLEVA